MEEHPNHRGLCVPASGSCQNFIIFPAYFFWQYWHILHFLGKYDTSSIVYQYLETSWRTWCCCACHHGITPHQILWVAGWIPTTMYVQLECLYVPGIGIPLLCLYHSSNESYRQSYFKPFTNNNVRVLAHDHLYTSCNVYVLLFLVTSMSYCFL